MTASSVDLLVPRILVVDDERQIHASLRLRLGRDYGLVCHNDPRQALALLREERFDLCIVDIHMPHLDGLGFVEAARQVDPDLGYIFLSAFDSDENLRRAIPLQVYDFIAKPLPDREGFEAKIPGWIEQTRRRRREHDLAERAAGLAGDLQHAQVARDVELLASETARDALLQTANLLTTIHAHLVTATTTLAGRARSEPGASHLLRNLDEARKTADAAITVAEGFFNSAYGNRDTSPALVQSGVRHALSIAMRMTDAERHNTFADVAGLDDRLPLRGVSGIDFLLLLVPAFGAAFTFARPGSTVRIEGCHVARLDTVLRDPRLKNHLWVNRRGTAPAHAALLLTVAASGPGWTRAEAEGWLRGAATSIANISARGLVLGVQKHRALLGLGVAPEAPNFHLALALPL